MGRDGKKKGKSRQEGAGVTEGQEREAFPFLNIRTWLAAFAVAVLTFTVFLPALGNDFVDWDDHVFVYENRHITNIDLAFLKWIFTNRETQWSPLRWLSHAIDYKIWGLNPLGHHLSSIILHSLNTFLVVVFVIKLFETAKTRLLPSPASEEEKGFRRRAVISGVIAGLLFGLHPLRVESVVWVSERKDVLYAFFFLLSLICYLEYYKSLHKKPGIFYYILCLFWFIFAVMSKAMAVTLPLVLLILDVYPLKRIDPRSAFTAWRKVFVEKIPFFGISAAVTVANIGVHESLGAIIPLVAVSFTDRVLLAVKSVAFYLMKMAWPFHLYLMYGEPYNVSFSIFEAGLLFFAAAVTASCIFLWYRGKRIWLAVWMYYIVMLLPVSVIKVFSFSFAHDRYTYMPSIGPFLLVGLGISLLWDKTYFEERFFAPVKKVAPLIVILIVVILGILTIKQIKVWSNSITLWSHELERNPNFSIGYSGRGKAYADMGENHKALDDLNKAIQYNPKDVLAYKTRANVYVKLGDYQKALKDLDKAIKVDPEFSEGYSNRCGVNIQVRNFEQAIKDCSSAIENNPENAMAYNNRGLAYSSLGEFEKAVTDYSKAIAFNPADPGFYRNRGTVYFNIDKKNEAIGDFQKAASLGDKKTQEFLKKYGIKW